MHRRRRARPPPATRPPAPTSVACLIRRSFAIRADSARSRSSTEPSLATTWSARCGLLLLGQLARLALVDQGVAARRGALASHLVGGDDRRRWCRRRSPSPPSNSSGTSTTAISVVGGQATRASRRSAPRPAGGSAARARSAARGRRRRSRRSGAVDPAVGGDLRAPALDQPAAQRLGFEQLVNDRVTGERRRAQAARKRASASDFPAAMPPVRPIVSGIDSLGVGLRRLGLGRLAGSLVDVVRRIGAIGRRFRPPGPRHRPHPRSARSPRPPGGIRLLSGLLLGRQRPQPLPRQRPQSQRRPRPRAPQQAASSSATSAEPSASDVSSAGGVEDGSSPAASSRTSESSSATGPAAESSEPSAVHAACELLARDRPSACSAPRPA